MSCFLIIPTINIVYIEKNSFVDVVIKIFQFTLMERKCHLLAQVGISADGTKKRGKGLEKRRSLC
jgi:hypothetical protein